MKTHKKFKPRRKSKPKPNKSSTPSSDKTKTELIPLSVIHPPASLNWRKNPSMSSSSGKPNESSPIGMGFLGAKRCHGSSSKPSPKTLFADRPDSSEGSASESENGSMEKTANSSSENVNKATMDSNTPPSPFQASGNPSSPSPLSITDWKFSAVPDALKFSDVSAKTKYHRNFSSRKLNRGRGILFSSFPESIVFATPLVKLFYSNLVIVSDDSENVCLKSFVLGKEFTLTTAYVNSLFGFPDEGSKFFSFGEWNTSEYTLADLRHIFWEGRAYSFSGGKALNNMSVEHFFLHKLIVCTLLSGTTSSGGHTTDINTVSMFLTFMAVHGRPVNLGFIILKYIAYLALHPSKNLPYGMLLTLVFRKENIALPHSWMEPPKERRTIDTNSLSKMRIHDSEAEGWYRGVKKTTKADTISLQDSIASLHTKIDSQSTAILALTTQIKRLRKKLRKKSLS
ncbi:hypothetical protein CDL12_17705 [Handroanthus impetiginosus]|uniref:Uncharacterized protein n=1 Tax=Handroanthus impetiginosus TaxID=429701 RepID=A0A2G9GWR3_9LAMI|nr:hypothetical protein CDL12_17705 [Handroanthus impetiginosus]